jgi:IS1 family transposase
VLAWELGTREYGTGEIFVQKLAHACHKADYQFSTDGWQPYKSWSATTWGRWTTARLSSSSRPAATIIPATPPAR